MNFRLMKGFVFTALAVLWLMPAPAQEQEKAKEGAPEDAPPLTLSQTPVDGVLQAYAERKHRTVLKDPGVPNATITLKSDPKQKLTLAEYLEAIEVVLEMNGVHVEDYGEKFIKAVPRTNARKEGIPFVTDKDRLDETGKVVSMVISFKNMAASDGQNLINGLGSGKSQPILLERTNAILVTDTEQNINRMLELVKMVDVAKPVQDQVYIRQIKYASVADIKTAIDQFVQESQKELEQEKGNKSVTANQPTPVRRTPTLLGKKAAPEPAAPASTLVVTDAERGVIRGKAMTLSDERSNKLVVVTNPDNMALFDNIIKELDIETAPDVKVEVIRLKYADAEETADMINDLIGNSSGSRNTSGKTNQNQTSKTGANKNLTTGNTRPATTTPRSAANSNPKSGSEAKAGELTKDNITVLADKRINGLVVMARMIDFPVLHAIIEQMDIKLAQVLIETCIVEIGLTDEIKTGVDWYRGINDAATHTENLIAGGGGSPVAPARMATSGLAYQVYSTKFDLGAIISASKSDSNSKYIASPVIMTVDNKEASIEATTMRYMLTGFTSSGNSYSTVAVPNYEQKQVGITIKTTPKINPNGTVMLTVEEEYSQVNPNAQTIQTSGGLSSSGSSTSSTSNGLISVSVDTTTTRKMSADISLEDGQTVVLGGLTTTETSTSDTGIPILKDIPWIGRYLFGRTQDTEERKELLVFMTPYVLNNADEAQAEAARRKDALSNTHPWEDHGWSKSKLADPISTKEVLRRTRANWREEDQNYRTQRKLEEAREERAEELEERAEDEAERRAERAERAARELKASGVIPGSRDE